ncbi:RNA-directed DNA polymerase from mobile element jockey [Paramuricea clavata]|uniref:RNA-directed DNA polymerase from mobile element jockey n=1 Tax=Paramuricea clavata TaxID=317549 RepID=A0A6S7G9T2_PARCT|nr:RNA-directed DNA polymerase from mobile element jockey [Paramuricea clavata]
MTAKKDKVDSIVFILPKAVSTIRESCPQCPTERNVRNLIKQVGGNTSFKSLFHGIEKKVSCVTVPRNAVNKDILKEIDQCFNENGMDETEKEDQEMSCEECEHLHEEIATCKETARREIEEARMLHEGEMESLRNRFSIQQKEKENKIDKLEEEVKALKRKMEETQVEAKRFQKMVENADADKKQTKKSAVVHALKEIVDVQPEAEQQVNDQSTSEPNLDDSDEHRKEHDMLATRPNSVICTLCSKKKSAGMIACVKCNQRFHYSCLKMNRKAAKKVKSTFLCSKCE